MKLVGRARSVFARKRLCFSRFSPGITFGVASCFGAGDAGVDEADVAVFGLGVGGSFMGLGETRSGDNDTGVTLGLVSPGASFGGVAPSPVAAGAESLVRVGAGDADLGGGCAGVPPLHFDPCSMRTDLGLGCIPACPDG